eukprot:Selendium_serpulae@DN5903_c0_g2_i2.p1
MCAMRHVEEAPAPAGPYEPPGIIESSLPTMGEARLRRTVYVGGLDEQVTAAVLTAAFAPFGEVRTVEIPTQKDSGKHRGFGFVEFDLDDDAAEGIANMHEAELFGRVLTVNLARKPARAAGEGGKPIWADDFFYRRKLAEKGFDVDVAALDTAPSAPPDA